MKRAYSIAGIALAIFVTNVLLNWPLFLPGDSPYRDTIEAGYMGTARFVAENPNPWGWNPQQYCGQPTLSTYVPLLPYTAAALSWTTDIDPVYSYKLLTGVLACLGPVTLFLFVLFFTGNLTWSALAASGYIFFSPLYGLIQQMDKDRGIVYLPWRMHVFAKYGEGPHVSALTLIPLALIAVFYAGSADRYWRVPAAAFLLACIPLTNWIGALALAVCCLLLLLASWGAPNGSLRMQSVLAASVLAWGFACFWLTPAFIRTVVFNWPVDSYNYQLQYAQACLLTCWVIGTLMLRVALWALRWPLYPTYVTLGVFAFGFPVLIYYSYGIDTLPESRRYAIEFALFLTLALAAFLHWTLASTNRVRQVCGAVLALALLPPACTQVWRYLTQGHGRWKPVPREQTPEYRVTQWIANQRPQGRVLASGGLRFRLNSWFPLQQVGGTFESGLRNRVPVHFAYQVRTGMGSTPANEAEQAILQMKALGVEYVVVHGPKSQEYYRDYRRPGKFEGALAKVYDDGDDIAYRVPFYGLAHLVRWEEQPLHPHRESIAAYVSALDDVSRPRLEFRQSGSSAMDVRGPIPAGYDVTVAVTYESGWQAWQDGKPVQLVPNKLNFIVAKVHSSAGSTVRFEYRETPEARGMAVISVFTMVGTTVWLRRRARRIYHGVQWPTRPAFEAHT